MKFTLDIKELNRGFAGEIQVAVLFSGQSVLTLRIKSTVTNNSKRALQNQTEGLTGLSGRQLAVALVVVCAALVAMMLYALITVAFTEVNPIAAGAAISVAVAGIAWFRKASFHK